MGTLYKLIISKCTNNVKATWKIVNNIITKKKSDNLFTDKFSENGIEITSKTDIANGHNNFLLMWVQHLRKHIRSKYW